MKKRADINKMITDRLIERIRESGSLPWKKPWSTPDLVPRNLISKKPYRGINAFLLFAMGFDSPWWLTMKQVNALGGKVRKGEHATPVESVGDGPAEVIFYQECTQKRWDISCLECRFWV